MSVHHKRCGNIGCTKRPSYGAAGTSKAKLCHEHAREGMVDVVSKRCGESGCSTQPNFGKAGTTKAEFCAAHATDRMVDVRNKRRVYQPSFIRRGRHDFGEALR